MTMRAQQPWLQVIGMTALLVAAGWMVTNWVFARFLHYHGQYRLLNPEDYNAEIITAEDYAALSNTDTMSVKLSDGREVSKAEQWHTIVLPKYKALDNGRRYVLVTVKGTAPFLPTLESTLLPVFVLLVFGLICTVAGFRNKPSPPKQRPT